MAGTVCWQGGQYGGQKKTVAIPKCPCGACRPHMRGFNQHTCVLFVFFVIYADHKKKKMMPEGGCGFSKLKHFKTIYLLKRFR